MSDLDTAEPGAPVVPETIVEEVQSDIEHEGEVEQESTPDKSDAKKDGVQKRINELTREKWAERREKQELQHKLEQLERQVYSPQPTAAPTLEGYGWDVDAYQQAVYQKALSDSQHAQQEHFKYERQRHEQEQEQRKFDVILQNHGVREQKYAKDVPDYYESVDYLVKSIKFDRAIGEIIGESERSPELLYHLATNFEEAASIAEMPLYRATAHLARLEAKLANKPKPVTKAPAPPPSLSGSSVAVKDPNLMSDEEYFRHRAESKSKK